MGKPKKRKRKRPKNRRAGCLMCKPHKVNGAKQGMPTRQEALARIKEKEFSKEVADVEKPQEREVV